MTPSDLEKICTSLNGTTQDIKWGNDLCYCVGGKMYCTTSVEGTSFISFKATPEEFAELTNRDGVIPAPYVAKYHWVLVQDLKALTLKEWRTYIQHSYELVLRKLPKNVRARVESLR